MQRIAQDWLVLTELTRSNASALGVVMALQFGPQLLLLPLTGFAADYCDRRKLLITTQALLGTLALLLGLLTRTGVVHLWHVYVIAFLFGCVSAFDQPANQTFVAELVGDDGLSNATALNSTSFNIARMIGPAIAGVVISTVGTWGAFVFNAASFAAVITALCCLRVDELHQGSKGLRARGGLSDGLRYVWQRPDLKTVLLMLFVVCTFGLNFPIFISTMSVSVFHVGAGKFGLLMSLMAIGSISGAFLSAARDKLSVALLFAASLLFGVGLTLAAAMPTYWLFAVTLVVVGASAVTFTTSTSSFMQLKTAPEKRGRVMAIRLAVGVGGTPIGAPFVGWVADVFGARWGVAVGAVSGFGAAIVALYHLARYQHLRIRLDGGRLRISFGIEETNP